MKIEIFNDSRLIEKRYKNGCRLQFYPPVEQT